MPHPIPQAMIDAVTQHADPDKAKAQQKYMKSEMPYAGISAPELRQIQREVFKAHPISSKTQWCAVVEALWGKAHVRELRYTAIELLLFNRYRKQWLESDVLPLIRHMVETGAWWDFIDNLASNAIGHILRNEPSVMRDELRRWASDDHLWVRRSAILAQLKFGENTDFDLLQEFIAGSLHDQDFFARKAIGWALRSYSRVDGPAVIEYVTQHQDVLSPLSKREALKVLRKADSSIVVP